MVHNYHGGKLVQRGPNPLSSHYNQNLRSSRGLVYFVCFLFAIYAFKKIVKGCSSCPPLYLFLKDWDYSNIEKNSN